MQFTSSTANVSENNKVAKGKASTSTIDARTSGNGGDVPVAVSSSLSTTCLETKLVQVSFNNQID